MSPVHARVEPDAKQYGTLFDISLTVGSTKLVNAP